MPRPVLPRRVGGSLEPRVFKPQGIPLGRLPTLELSLDGLEALRLADAEGLYQEEAARRMGVSRATFARVLEGARRTVARALVEGCALDIGGGVVVERRERKGPCPVHAGRRRGRRCRCRRGGGGGGRERGA
jgi:predicted DNA-binding protein (UPF0251 family)